MSEIFSHSFALLDADSRLVDWDEGFAQEFRFDALLLKPGMVYCDILRAAASDPTARQSFLENSEFSTAEELVRDRLRGFGRNRTCEYRTVAGRVVRVDEHRTISGGIRRSTRDITDDSDSGKALITANKWLDAGDSDLGSAVIEIRLNANGTFEFPPITLGVRRLLDLPAEAEGQDARLIHQHMNASADQDAMLAAALRHASETLEICVMEYRIWDGKGRPRWIRQSMMPRCEAGGSVIFAGIMRDITREKEAEDQVELLQTVVVRSSDAIAIFETVRTPDSLTKILYVNGQFTELFGGSAAAIVGQPIAILSGQHPKNKGVDFLPDAAERNDGASFEYEVQGPDGRVLWVEMRVMTVQKLENGGFRWVTISRDATERRHSLDELIEAKEAAEAGNRAKGAFLANMSHELRTPLHAIIGFTELVEGGVARTGWAPSYAEYLADVSGSGRHLLALINTILDLSKLEAGQLPLSLGRVDLGELLRSAITTNSETAQAGKIAVTMGLGWDSTHIEGDYSKLKQVLLNVISNAIKFTPAGGRVDITMGVTETDAHIAVTDTGCGIPARDLERVMLPFAQVGNTLSRNFEGSGLGLPIARELCSLHGGRLEIGSVEGQGTKVFISLPLGGPGRGAIRTRSTIPYGSAALLAGRVPQSSYGQAGYAQDRYSPPLHS
jgi:PAS domain S-box-containing protein